MRNCSHFFPILQKPLLGIEPRTLPCKFPCPNHYTKLPISQLPIACNMPTSPQWDLAKFSSFWTLKGSHTPPDSSHSPKKAPYEPYSSSELSFFEYFAFFSLIWQPKSTGRPQNESYHVWLGPCICFDQISRYGMLHQSGRVGNMSQSGRYERTTAFGRSLPKRVMCRFSHFCRSYSGSTTGFHALVKYETL